MAMQGCEKMVERYDYDHTMSESLSAYPDGQFILYSDYATLAAEVEQLRKKLDLAIAKCEFWQVADRLSIERAEKAEAEVERMAKELAFWKIMAAHGGYRPNKL